MLHERPQREPEAVENGEIVGEHIGGGRGGVEVVVVGVVVGEQPPLVGGEPGHDEEDDGDADVGEDDADPDLLRQRVQEAEDPRLLFDRLLDHDADAQRHEGFAEVYHPLSFRGDRH